MRQTGPLWRWTAWRWRGRCRTQHTQHRRRQAQGQSLRGRWSACHRALPTRHERARQKRRGGRCVGKRSRQVCGDAGRCALLDVDKPPEDAHAARVEFGVCGGERRIKRRRRACESCSVHSGTPCGASAVISRHRAGTASNEKKDNRSGRIVGNAKIPFFGTRGVFKAGSCQSVGYKARPSLVPEPEPPGEAPKPVPEILPAALEAANC